MKKLLLVVVFLALALRSEGSNCGSTSVGLVPLIDGPGLYPSGLNTLPVDRIQTGQQLAASLRLRPVNVLMSVGMSNANQHFERFRRNELVTPDKAKNLVIVNGATGKQSSDDWANPSSDAYAAADQQLAAAGASPGDVGVLWVLLTEAANADLPTWHANVRANTRAALATLVSRYPNTEVILLASRIYGGYASPGSLNPEPYAYASGLIMKELLGEHLNGQLLPNRWMGWGPYLWADGLIPRSDGLIWQCGDFQNDGTHPSAQGTTKVAALLSSFLRSDPVARLWFLEGPGPVFPPRGGPPSPPDVRGGGAQGEVQ